MYRLIFMLTIAISLLVFIINFRHIMPEFSPSDVSFRYYCAQCHGLDGKGGGPNALKHLPVDPRDLTDKVAMGKLSDDEIMDVIRFGGKGPRRSTVMPPFEKTLREIEIIYMKDYLRDLCDC